MLKKSISRTFALLILETIIIAGNNAPDISAFKLIMSLGIVIVLETSIIVNNLYLEILLITVAFVAVPIIQPTISTMLITVFLYALIICDLLNVRKITKLNNRLKNIADEGSELELKLIETNRRLIAEQDNEIKQATLSERSRIAREIHDNVGHMLSRAILLLGAIKTVNKDENITKHLETMQETLDSAMHQMRTSVHDLHDKSFDFRAGVEDTLKALKDYTVITDINLGLNPSPECQLTILAILKEAVSNIIRHSTADTVNIVLHEHPGFVTLSVSDNGKISDSFRDEIATGITSGIGLSNIKERAEKMGGFASFTADRGFTVFVNIPSKSENTGRGRQ